MASARQTPTTSKWSLNTKAHNPTRVRDNQRRHRARVKARTESLETELRQSQQELRKSRDRIDELEGLLAARYSANAMNGRSHDSPSEPGLLGSTSSEQGYCDCPLRPSNQPSQQLHHQSSAESPDTRIPIEGSATSSSVLADPLRDHDGRFPLVAHGESTTLCRVAYEIIAQQNMTDIDVSDMEQWLWPGFRRATRQGEGCRVNTKVLYALIDHISPL